MPYAKSGRRKYQSMDFQVGFIRQALKIEFAKKDKCNTRLIIELLDRLAYIDTNYDVVAIRGRKLSDDTISATKTPTGRADIEAEQEEKTSSAVEAMLAELQEEKENVASATNSIPKSSVA